MAGQKQTLPFIIILFGFLVASLRGIDTLSLR